MGFCTNIFLAKILGATGLGVYAYAFTWVNLLNIFALLGIHELIIRDLAIFRSSNQEKYLKGMLLWANLVVLLSSVIMTVLAVGSVWLFSQSIDYKIAMTIAFLSLPFLALSSIRTSALRAWEHILWSQIPEAVIRPVAFLLLLTGFYLTLGNGLSVRAVVTLASGSTVLAFLCGSYLLQRLTSQPHVVPDIIHRRWLKDALPFLLFGGILLINTRSDLIMVGLFLTSKEVGIYSVVVRLAELITFVLFAANTAAGPVIAKLFHSKDMKNLERTVRLSTLGVFLLSLPIGIMLILFGKLGLGVFGQEFVEGYPVLIVLVCGQLINTATGITAQVLNMTHHQNDTAKALGVSAILNIVLNAVLIPRFGVMGAAYATSISLALWNVILIFVVYKRLGFYSLFGLINFEDKNRLDEK